MPLASMYGSPLQISSYGLWLPQPAASIIRPTLSWGAVTLDAAGERVAMLGSITTGDYGDGHVVSSSGGTIHADLSAVTFGNAGTTIEVGLQDISGANPDGTFDVKGTYVGGTDPLANGPYSFAMETGTKTINNGQDVAVVFHMTARNTDTISINCTVGPSSVGRPWMRLDTTGTYAALARFPNVMIKADNGIPLYFEPYLFRVNNVGTAAFQVGTAGFDEYGMTFKQPFPYRISSFSIPLAFAAATSDFEFNIYTDRSSPSLLYTELVDAAMMGNTSTTDAWMTIRLVTPFDADAGVEYYWTVRPTAAQTVTLSYVDFGNNGNMITLPMRDKSYLVKRLNNSGGFSDDLAKHAPFFMNIQALHDGSGGGGGIRKPIMRVG